MYNVFIRTWYRVNPSWPNGLEPHAGRKSYLRKRVTREQAVKICEEYNNSHNPGKLSRKAEFEQC